MSISNPLNLGHEKYPALTGIRAIGASLIFFDHIPQDVNSHSIINILSFFFVLSGFLIAYLYYESSIIKGQWLYGYFVNRFARIYPVYFLLLTITILYQHKFHAIFLIKNYTLTHALFHNTADFAIQPSWSLTVEECFYAIAPFLFLLSKRKNILAVLIALSALLVCAVLISMLGTGFLGTPMFVFTATFFGHFMEFYSGIYLALLILKLEKQDKVSLKGYKYTLWGMVSLTVLITLTSKMYDMNTPNRFTWLVFVNNFIIPYPIALLYFGIIREQTIISRLLSGKLLNLLGKGSYAFYLCHMLVIDYIALPHLLKQFNNHIYFVIVVYLICLIISTLIYLLYEKPLNQLIRKRFLPAKKPNFAINAT